MAKKRESKRARSIFLGECCFFHWRIARNNTLRSHDVITTPDAPFSTCDFCDVHKQDQSGAFRVMPPVFRDFGGLHVFSGPVYTVQCFEDNSFVKQAVDSQGWIDTPQGRVGQVLVVDGGASLRRALLGGNLAAAAAKNGWAGVVIDGCVRDVAELEQHALGIRALAAMPLPTEKRQQGQAQVPVSIQGVWVRPGDWLYADRDGMVLSTQPLM
jgi:regulator of ribonuclease activity A